MDIHPGAVIQDTSMDIGIRDPSILMERHGHIDNEPQFNVDLDPGHQIIHSHNNDGTPDNVPPSRPENNRTGEQVAIEDPTQNVNHDTSAANLVVPNSNAPVIDDEYVPHDLNKFEAVYGKIVWFHGYIGIISFGGLIVVFLQSALVPLMFSFLIFYIGDTVREICSWHSGVTQSQRRMFILERGIVLLWLILFVISFIQVNNYKVLSVLPYTIYTVYQFYSRINSAIQEDRVPYLGPPVFKSMVIVAFCMIVARADGLYNASWYLVMLIGWFYTFITLCIFIWFVIISCIEIRRPNPTEEQTLHLRIGLLIAIELLFFTCLQALVYFGIARYMEEKDNTILIIGFLVGIFGATIAILLLCCMKREYMEAMLATENYRRERERQNADQDDQEIELRRERKKGFTMSETRTKLSRISATYFQVLRSLELKPSATKKVSEPMKNNYNVPQENSEMPLKPTETVEPKGKAQKNLEFDSRSLQVNMLNIPDHSAPNSSRRGAQSGQLVSDRHHYNIEGEEAMKIVSNQVATERRASRRADETRISAQKLTPTPGEDDASSLCIICFIKPSDSVLMPCGHGGICYECAKDMWLKRDDCYMCRQIIAEILQIDPETLKGAGPIQVIGSTKMVYLSDRSHGGQ